MKHLTSELGEDRGTLLISELGEDRGTLLTSELGEDRGTLLISVPEHCSCHTAGPVGVSSAVGGCIWSQSRDSITHSASVGCHNRVHYASSVVTGGK